MDASNLRLSSHIAEFQISKTEIDAGDPISSLRNSQKRHNGIVSKILATANARICCAKGCWYCCYFKIDLRAYEILVICDFVNNKLSASQAKLILSGAEGNASLIRLLSEKEQLAANLKCPFLIEGACSIYEVRPSNCRNFHSTDVQRCKKSYDEPNNMQIKNAFIEEFFFAGKGHFEGFKQAVEETHYDSASYELNTAFLDAMKNNSALKRFRKRKRTFLEALLVE